MATVRDTIPAVESDAKQYGTDHNVSFSVRSRYVEHAMDAMRSGHRKLHDGLIAACAADFHDCDALLLAQHSMGSAREAIKDVPGCKILTSPETAVLKLRQLLTETVFD